MASLCNHENGLENKFTLPINQSKILTHKENPTMYQNFIIPYLYEVRRVSGDTPFIIRSLKLHWRPFVFYTWKVVGRADGGCCQAHCVPDVYQLPVQQPPRPKHQRPPVQF
jgi:hypothetical protein